MENINYKGKGEHSVNELEKIIEQREEDLAVTDKLLFERQKVLDAIPECKSHGGNCVPHALEWIEEQISKLV